MERYGIGAFMRKLPGGAGGIKAQQELDRDIRRAGVAGMRHVALMVTFQSSRGQRGNSPAIIRQYAEGFAKHGVKVGLWGYPWIGREAEFMAAMDAAWCDAVSFGVLNAEGGVRVTKAGKRVPINYKYGPTTKEHVQERAKFTAGEFQLWCERRKLDNVFSSYGIAAQHRNFPWTEFLTPRPIMSPQLYNASVGESQTAFADWNTLARLAIGIDYSRFLIGIGAFGAMSGEMMDRTLQGYTDGFPGLLGGIIWSWPQIDRTEFAAIKRYAGVWR